MKNILIVIDMQKDFVDGALGSMEASAIAPELVSFVKNFEGEVVFTRDTHEENYMDTQEGKYLPVPHCIRGSAGWQLIPELEEFRKEHQSRVFDKPTFGSTALAEVISREYTAGEISSVTFAGVCTDICVITNALLVKAAQPEMPVYCAEKLCAGVTPAKHEAALETMRSCQIQMI